MDWSLRYVKGEDLAVRVAELRPFLGRHHRAPFDSSVLAEAYGVTPTMLADFAHQATAILQEQHVD